MQLRFSAPMAQQSQLIEGAPYLVGCCCKAGVLVLLVCGQYMDAWFFVRRFVHEHNANLPHCRLSSCRCFLVMAHKTYCWMTLQLVHDGPLVSMTDPRHSMHTQEVWNVLHVEATF
jgi:hypothetical protein